MEFEESYWFRTSSYVFQRNYVECRDYLGDLEHDPAIVLAMAKSRKKQEQTSWEVTRLLANCVGAAVSLRNAVNGTHRRLHRDGTFAEFVMERRARYDTNPVIQFVVRLRNYLVHVKPVAIRFTFWLPTPSDPSEPRLQLSIDLEGLRKDATRWGRKPEARAAKRYLDDLRDSPFFFLLIDDPPSHRRLRGLVEILQRQQPA